MEYEQAVSNPGVIFNAIENLRVYMEQLWLEALRYDSISPTTKYATFSQSNESTKRLEQATTKLAEAVLLSERLVSEGTENETNPVQFSNGLLGRDWTPVHCV